MNVNEQYLCWNLALSLVWTIVEMAIIWPLLSCQYLLLIDRIPKHCERKKSADTCTPITHLQTTHFLLASCSAHLEKMPV